MRAISELVTGVTIMLALVGLFSLPAIADERIDGGGEVRLYVAATLSDRAAFQATGVRRPVPRDCYSACTLRVAMASEAHCVRWDTRLHFHAGTDQATGERIMRLPYPPAVQRWIDAQGGLPLDGWLTMEWPETRQFWRVC